MLSRRLLLGALAATLALGCGQDKREGELTVFAAASLKDVFEVLASDFERQNPGVKIVFSFAGSQSLRTQIEHGADPDLFASADLKHVDALREGGLVGDGQIFAQNRLAIVVPPNNPAGVTSLRDLVSAERLVLAGTNVPAGSYADAVLKAANAVYGSDFANRVGERVVSRELDVRHALQKVVLGEADAAIVYATDAASAGDRVKTIEIPDELNVTALYPIAATAGSAQSKLADRFIQHIRSEDGAAVLERFGFRPAAVITAGR